MSSNSSNLNTNTVSDFDLNLNSLATTLSSMKHSTSYSSLLEECIEVITPSSPGLREQQKICDKLQKIADNKNEVRYSFEYFPPKTQQGIENLTSRISRMGLTQPLFIDITHSRDSSTLDLAEKVLEHTSLDIMCHLSMTNMSKYEIRQYLNRARDLGIRNLLIIRGDPPRGYDTWEAVEDDLQHSADLIRFIRAEYDTYFCLCVGAYPEGHVHCTSIAQDILYLKEKIDSGADLIITQLFYDVNRYLQFVDECRAIGIECPIIPGLMPIHTYAQFLKIISFNNIKVPLHIWDALDPIKMCDEKVKEYGVKLIGDMCRQILKSDIKTLHFYTMNLEVCVNKILQDLHLITSLTKRAIYPWECARSHYRNKKESVRPIFWSNRTESYIHRTSHWDEFPNGRWGDNRSPAYGEFPDHHLLNIDINTNLNKRRKMYGNELHSIHNICKVFVDYLCNSNEVNQLPWCSQSIHSETIKYLLHPLKILNSHGFLTINSQPQINGIRSCESIIGWGRKDGIIYQKAYLEFFCNAEQLQILLRFIDERHKSLTYQAVNHQNLLKSNCSLSNVNAVTWGVFPCCEIIQPTIVDPISFLSWKDEAFSLWQSDWQNIYSVDGNGNGYELIGTIVDEWFLVNIVENNYLDGNIFQPFVDYFQFIHENKMDGDIGGVFEMSAEELQCMTCSLVQNNGKVSSELDEVKCDDESLVGDVDDIVNNPYLDEKLLVSIQDSEHICDYVDGKIN